MVTKKGTDEGCWWAGLWEEAWTGEAALASGGTPPGLLSLTLSSINGVCSGACALQSNRR